jgi:hypothetical protein
MLLVLVLVLVLEEVAVCLDSLLLPALFVGSAEFAGKALDWLYVDHQLLLVSFPGSVKLSPSILPANLTLGCEVVEWDFQVAA